MTSPTCRPGPSSPRRSPPAARTFTTTPDGSCRNWPRNAVANLRRSLAARQGDPPSPQPRPPDSGQDFPRLGRGRRRHPRHRPSAPPCSGPSPPAGPSQPRSPDQRARHRPRRPPGGMPKAPPVPLQPASVPCGNALPSHPSRRTGPAAPKRLPMPTSPPSPLRPHLDPSRRDCVRRRSARLAVGSTNGAGRSF